jgi:hypothetical protein
VSASVSASRPATSPPPHPHMTHCHWHKKLYSPKPAHSPASPVRLSPLPPCSRRRVRDYAAHHARGLGNTSAFRHYSDSESPLPPILGLVAPLTGVHSFPSRLLALHVYPMFDECSSSNVVEFAAPTRVINELLILIKASRTFPMFSLSDIRPSMSGQDPFLRKAPKPLQIL